MIRLKLSSIFVLVLLTGCISVYPFYDFHHKTVRGNGDIVTIEREVGYFDAIRITGSRSSVVYGDHEGPVRITADENLLDYIVTEVQDNRLLVTTENNVNLRATKRVHLEIPARFVNDIRVSGSNRMTLEEIDQHQFNIRGSGSTRIEAHGFVDELNIRMSGSSRIDAGNLISEIVSLRTSGSSRAKIHALDVIEARTSGSSRIQYYGKPTHIQSQSTGSSSISSIELVNNW